MVGPRKHYIVVSHLF